MVNESTLAPGILTLLSLLKVAGELPLAQNLPPQKKVISITFCSCKVYDTRDRWKEAKPVGLKNTCEDHVEARPVHKGEFPLVVRVVRHLHQELFSQALVCWTWTTLSHIHGMIYPFHEIWLFCFLKFEDMKWIKLQNTKYHIIHQSPCEVWLYIWSWVFRCQSVQVLEYSLLLSSLHLL